MSYGMRMKDLDPENMTVAIVAAVPSSCWNDLGYGYGESGDDFLLGIGAHLLPSGVELAPFLVDRARDQQSRYILQLRTYRLLV